VPELDTQAALRDLNAERTAERRRGPSRRQLERGEGTRTRTRRGGPRGGGPQPNPEFQQSSKTTSKAPAATGVGKATTKPGTGGTEPPSHAVLAKGIGGAVGAAIVSLITTYIGGIIQQYFDNKRIQKALNEMQPAIQAALNRRQGEIEKLLQQSHIPQTIYANVQVDVILQLHDRPRP
jgi:hypothetical protein